MHRHTCIRTHTHTHTLTRIHICAYTRTYERTHIFMHSARTSICVWVYLTISIFASNLRSTFVRLLFIYKFLYVYFSLYVHLSRYLFLFLSDNFNIFLCLCMYRYILAAVYVYSSFFVLVFVCASAFLISPRSLSISQTLSFSLTLFLFILLTFLIYSPSFSSSYWIDLRRADELPGISPNWPIDYANPQAETFPWLSHIPNLDWPFLLHKNRMRCQNRSSIYCFCLVPRRYLSSVGRIVMNTLLYL